MALDHFLQGKTLVLTCTYTLTATGALFDPDEVTCTVRHPDASTTTPPPTHPSLGIYRYSIPLTVGGGVLTATIQASGLVGDAEEYRCFVRKQAS